MTTANVPLTAPEIEILLKTLNVVQLQGVDTMLAAASAAGKLRAAAAYLEEEAEKEAKSEAKKGTP